MSSDRNHADTQIFSDAPETYQPTKEELTARNKRSVAIALGLVAFMVFVFLTMLARAGAL